MPRLQYNKLRPSRSQHRPQHLSVSQWHSDITQLDTVQTQRSFIRVISFMKMPPPPILCMVIIISAILFSSSVVATSPYFLAAFSEQKTAATESVTLPASYFHIFM